MKRFMMKMNHRYNLNKGFSLVELIIVIAIMAILAAAIAPALVRYIDKSRKAVDIETAQMIYEAANLASATSSDDAAAGWSVIQSHDGDRVCVNIDGHRCSKWHDNDTTGSYYVMRPVAWCRGIRYDGKVGEWENSLFKANLDGEGGDAALQRAWTDEFLANLNNEEAQGGHTGHRNYDGQNNNNIAIKCKKPSKLLSTAYDTWKDVYNFDAHPNHKPECWIVYRRDDNGACEIWIGYKDGGVRPLYRLYPNTCAEYTN